MGYKNSILKFYERKIVTEDTNSEVMASWEEPVMQKHVDLVTHNCGDILEIGFGMGIAASQIQNKNVKSHTIVEMHPQILERMEIWSKNKTNVTILAGDWIDLQDIILSKKYDGIFFDTHLDDNRPIFRKLIVDNCIKENGIFTYFNIGNLDTYAYGDKLKYHIVNVEPDKECSYFFKKYMIVPYIKY